VSCFYRDWWLDEWGFYRGVADMSGRHIGILTVHGIGENGRFDQAAQVARMLATFITQRKDVESFSLADRRGVMADTALDLPALGPNSAPMTLQFRIKDRAEDIFIHVHEVYWADIAPTRGLMSEVKFWFWGLGQWFAKIERMEKSAGSNTEKLMVGPQFPKQKSPKHNPPLLLQLRTVWNFAAAAFLAILTFFSWTIFKKVGEKILPIKEGPSVIFDYLGDVQAYQQDAGPGDGALIDAGQPWRATIRRRMNAQMIAMAERRYSEWYILAHSLGSVVAFNGLQESEFVLPNYLSQAHWQRLPGVLRTWNYFVHGNQKPDPTRMMPRRPPWLNPDDGISRVALFKNFKGLLTYGSPLDKFAAVWPRIVCLSKQINVFQPGCAWINLHDPTDPVSDILQAFDVPKGYGDTSGLIALAPKNIIYEGGGLFKSAYPFNISFLLSHLKYLDPRKISKQSRFAGASLVNQIIDRADFATAFDACARSDNWRRGMNLYKYVQGILIAMLLVLLSATLWTSAKKLADEFYSNASAIFTEKQDSKKIHAEKQTLQKGVHKTDAGIVTPAPITWLPHWLEQGVKRVVGYSALLVLGMGIFRRAREEYLAWLKHKKRKKAGDES
jgi:hypothetical protein